MEPPEEFVNNREQGRPPDTTETATRDTRSDLATGTDSTKDPAVRFSFTQKRETIYKEVGEGWIKHASLFEQKYFEASIASDNAKELYNRVKKTMHPDDRWERMPESPKDEDEIREALVEIVQALEAHWSGDRDGTPSNIIDTHKMLVRDRHPRDSSYLQPDLFFKGSGASFPVHTNTTSKSPQWFLCTSPADAKRSGGNIKAHFRQLGTYSEQVFSAQENRRFVPTFQMDESSFQFFLFDRGGAVSGHRINYHADPWKLCALVQHLLLFEASDTGFDPSIYHQDGFTYIQTRGPTETVIGPIPASNISPETYIVDQTLFHSTDIRGNGSIYWLVHKNGDDDDDARYIIKDSWVVGGRANEQRLLERCRGIQGVAPLVHIQDVAFQGQLDSVSNNRPRGLKTPPSDDRIHTRVVLRALAGAKFLDRFSNTKELLEALRDAVKGTFFAL
jgi:hypothetical protein